jgi:carbonic anhydrase
MMRRSAGSDVQRMFTRRLFCGCLPAAASFVAAAVTSVSTARAQSGECAVFTAALQKSITPDQAMERLKAGNARFVAGKSANCDMLAQVRGTAEHQYPIAAIVGCIDSRVPPEVVFDQHLGAIFAARVAGNFVNTDILGSLEYAIKVAGVKAIVVLGHSECGAIKGAVDQVKLGNLTSLLANIQPALDAHKVFAGEKTSHNHELVQAVAETNARLAVQAILARSPVLKELADAGQLRIAAAMEDLKTGRVTFLS